MSAAHSKAQPSKCSDADEDDGMLFRDSDDEDGSDGDDGGDDGGGAGDEKCKCPHSNGDDDDDVDDGDEDDGIMVAARVCDEDDHGVLMATAIFIIAEFIAFISEFAMFVFTVGLRLIVEITNTTVYKPLYLSC